MPKSLYKLLTFLMGSCHACTRRNHITLNCCAQDLHARFQPLLLFFVDGANFINPEEPEWDLLLAVRTNGAAVTVVSLVTPFPAAASMPHADVPVGLAAPEGMNKDAWR